MKVLYLGPECSRLLAYLHTCGDTVVRTEEKLHPSDTLLQGVEFAVSYGYRHIVKPWLLARLPGRIINLHISYLPWNRGADPNLWSFLENTPKGVTIHLMDEGLDTGPILVQRKVAMFPEDTLRTSYERLSREIENLFMECWPDIRAGRLVPRPQPPGGSLHRLKDRKAVEHLLIDGWDTPIRHLEGKALTVHRSQECLHRQ